MGGTLSGATDSLSIDPTYVKDTADIQVRFAAPGAEEKRSERSSCPDFGLPWLLRGSFMEVARGSVRRF